MILITGGAGFIGSNLAKALVNNNVLILDNFHTGTMDNLKDIISRVELIKGDCSQILGMKLPHINHIFHFGIASSSPMYKQNPFLFSDTIKGIICVFELARKNDSKVIFASSSSLYNQLTPPHNEEMEIKPTDYYTEARFTGERIAKLYNHLYGIKCVILRLFSVYGIGEKAKGKYANVISQFLWSMVNNERPVIFGDGTQSRDFIYIKDVVRGCILAMESNIEFDIFNMGTGVQTSFNEIINILNKILRKRIEPVYVKNPIGNYVYHTQANMKKTEEKLKFKAKYSVEEGINEIYKAML